MTYLRWGIGLILIGLITVFLNYSLPDREVVRIVGTEVVRIDVERPNGEIVVQDQRQINAQTPNGRPSVYRNEDTDWGWPPYLKFDSADLQAEAQSNASQSDSWVVVQHYGWRIPLLSMFPNVISISPAEGRDQTFIPWFNIILVSFLILTVLIVRRVFVLMFDRHVSPVISDIDTEIEETSDAISKRYSGFMGWIRRATGN